MWLFVLALSASCGDNALESPEDIPLGQHGRSCQPLGAACDPDDAAHGTPDYCCSNACEQDRETLVTTCVPSFVQRIDGGSFGAAEHPPTVP